MTGTGDQSGGVSMTAPPDTLNVSIFFDHEHYAGFWRIRPQPITAGACSNGGSYPVSGGDGGAEMR